MRSACCCGRCNDNGGKPAYGLANGGLLSNHLTPGPVDVVLSAQRLSGCNLSQPSPIPHDQCDVKRITGFGQFLCEEVLVLRLSRMRLRGDCASGCAEAR